MKISIVYSEAPARERSPIALKIWQPIELTNFGCHVIVQTYVRTSVCPLHVNQFKMSLCSY